MKRNKKKYRSHCPINFAQEIFGDKWSLLIIRDLMFKGKKYYGEFLNSDEKISTNILADRLEKLEADRLITKSIDKENHSKNIYALTQKGVDLLPMLLEMIAWSAKYDNKTGTPAEFIRRLKEDKDSLIRELIASLGNFET
jgi:DNA-binding HxlR family transcriptional regulator